VISSGIENSKLLKIQGLATEFVKAQAIDPDVLVRIMNKKSVHEVENILAVALAEKKEEMMSIQKMQQALEQSEAENAKLTAEIARLENNASMASKERLELDKSIAKADESIRNRELTITEDKNKKDDKIAQQEVVLKKQTVELEKEQLLFTTGNAKEIKNNF
jgi:chromosome segregation ATPase